MNFENINIIPRELSTNKSRSDKDIDLSIPFGKQRLSMPILHSPMDTVGGLKMATLFTKNKLMGCFPRQDWKIITSLVDNFLRKNPCIVSVGLDDSKIATEDLYVYSNIRYFLVDVANGFNKNVENMVERLKSYPDTFVIAGNVASKEGYQYLAGLNVDAIRVGIGVGSHCETTTTTGIGTSIVGSIRECYKASLEMENPPLIIADGGLNQVGDIAKIIALGADLVMLGSLFSGTAETPGKIIIHEGEKYKVYRGSASYGSQLARNNSTKYVEGTETLVRYKGSSQKVLDKIDAGLRSALSYMNAGTIAVFRVKCQKEDCIKFI